HLTDLQGVVALNLRQIDRQHEHGAVEPDPQPDIGQTAEQEVALLEQAQVDQVIVPGQLQDDKAHQADQGDGTQGGYVGGLQPVLALPLLKKNLQAAQPQGHGQDPGVIPLAEQLPSRRAPVQAIHQAPGHQHTGDDVDVEDPFPAEALGQPAADGGADGRCEGGGDGKQCHALWSNLQRQLGQYQ